MLSLANGTDHADPNTVTDKSIQLDQAQDRVAPARDRRRAAWRWLELALLAAGLILLAVYAGARIDGWMSSDAALQQFDQARSGKDGETPDIQPPPSGQDGIDFSLWSPQRIRAFLQSLTLKQGLALAVLELDRLRIRVPVFEGTDELALNRGTGWIRGTARPGELGNTGIAGHRDGFFRVLMNVQAGDLIELQLPDRTMIYRVSRTEIINPENIQVLKPGREPALTLVTCYPFYYVGNAPQRFIVHASLQSTKPAEPGGVAIERP
jgi:sortase A